MTFAGSQEAVVSATKPPDRILTYESVFLPHTSNVPRVVLIWSRF